MESILRIRAILRKGQRRYGTGDVMRSRNRYSAAHEKGPSRVAAGPKGQTQFGH